MIRMSTPVYCVGAWQDSGNSDFQNGLDKNAWNLIPARASLAAGMVRFYFLFGKKPIQTQTYNPLQKLAYTTAIAAGALSLASGLVMYNPVQFSWLGSMMGGFHYARIWHFVAMCVFLSFIPGHLLMVVLHGWNNFMGMLSGWKKIPNTLTTRFPRTRQRRWNWNRIDRIRSWRFSNPPQNFSDNLPFAVFFHRDRQVRSVFRLQQLNSVGHDHSRQCETRVPV